MIQSFFVSLKNRHQRKGFVAVTFALMSTVLIGFAGMAVDAGYMQWNKRRVQVAADAAAMGALRELELGHAASLLTSAGLNDAGLNGFTNGQNNVTVNIYNPPITGAYTGNTSAVQAVVTRDFPTLFMRMFGENSITLTAKATGETTTSAGSIGGCIFELNKTLSNALTISGNLTVNTKCSVIAESNASQAFNMTGGAVLNLGTGAQVGVVGGYNLGGQSMVYDNSGTSPVSKPPVHIQDPGDPLAAIPNPSTSNVPVLTVRSTSNVTYSKNNVPTNSQIQPGVYCGGITIGDSDDKTYTFMPGVYILAGGGLTITASGAKATGTGITFYNTGTGGNNYASWGCATSSSYSPLAVTGGTLSFKAPTTGTFEGMLFFSDRALGSGSGKFDQVVGNATNTFDGALYFKAGNLKFAGTSSVTGYLVLVADNIIITGNTTLGNNYTSLSLPNVFAPYSTGGGMVE